MAGASLKWVVNSDLSRDEFIKRVNALYDEHKYVTFHWELGKQRSPRQNNALHLYCGSLANALNEAGLDMRTVLKPAVEINWTKDTVKNYLWRPIQVLVTGDQSTVDPDSDEYPQVFETLYRHMASKFGIAVPWPTKENGK